MPTNIGRGQLGLTDMNDVIASPTQPTSPVNGMLWWDTINKKLWVYNNGWNISADYEKYVQSRSENLVTNGTGLLGNNTNFSQFTFDGSQVYAGGGSFYTNVQNTTRLSDELIPVDVSRKYKFSLMAKQNLGIGNAYLGVGSYDIDKNVISPFDFYGSQYPVTTLATDLKVGDTVINLVSSTGFMDDSATPDHRHSIVFWNYKNSYGYEYPVGTYSRRHFDIGWNTGAINRTTHVITLNKPFNISNPNDAQGIFRAGQKVSPTSSGGSYQYTTAQNQKIPTTWTKYEGLITGTGIGANIFPHGTSFVKLLFLLNRDSSGGQAGDATWVNSLSFTDVTDVEDIKVTLGNMANDNLLDFQERQYVKDKITDIIGYIISDATTTLPTTATNDLGTSGKGSFYFTRKNAVMAGFSTTDAKYTAMVTAYDALKVYLEGLTPIKPWDLRVATQSTNIIVVKDTFRDKWLKYYQAELDLANATADQLKKNVDNVAVGGTNYLSNGNFEFDITKSLWSASYVGQVKEVVDISTETPPFKYAYHVKNTTNAVGGIFTPVLWSGVSAEAMVNKEITVSFWLKYQNIVQGVSAWHLGRFGELVIEGTTSGGAKVYSYPRFATPTTITEVAYIAGTNMTWAKYSATFKLTLPATATKLSQIQFKHGLENCVGEFWTTGLKIEIGNKATDWSQSPYDVNARLTSVEFEVRPDSIYSSLTSSEAFNAVISPNAGDWKFEKGYDLWKLDHALTMPVTGVTTVTGVAGASGKNVLQITGEKTLFYGRKIPIDTSHVYRVTFKVKQTVNGAVGATKVFAGVAGYDVNKTPLVTGTFGSHRYNAIDNKNITVADGWLTFSETITGEGNDGYGQFIPNTKYVTPIFIVNNASGTGTVQVAECTFEDITNTDSLATQVNNLSVLLTPDGITTEIGNSTFYKNLYGDGAGIEGDLNAKADASALGDYTSKEDFNNFKTDEFGNLVGSSLDDLINDKSSRLNVEYATNYKLEETSKNMTAKFSATGGMNLLKNSIGFADFTFWSGYDANIDTVSNDDIIALGFGSGFQFKKSTAMKLMSQDIPVINGKPHTLSWYIDKNNASVSTDDNGAFWVQIMEAGIVMKQVKYNSEYVTNGYESNFAEDKIAYNLNYTPTADKVTVRMVAYKDAEVFITGLMFTIGDTALQWSLATGETYNTNVRLDINGIRVSQMQAISESDPTKVEVGYTEITPDEFAGYYRKINPTTQMYDMEKVFYLNADETVTKKLRAIDEITLGTLKIINVNAGGNTGWAFVPIVEE